MFFAYDDTRIAKPANISLPSVARHYIARESTFDAIASYAKHHAIARALTVIARDSQSFDLRHVANRELAIAARKMQFARVQSNFEAQAAATLCARAKPCDTLATAIAYLQALRDNAEREKAAKDAARVIREKAAEQARATRALRNVKPRVKAARVATLSPVECARILAEQAARDSSFSIYNRA